MAKSFCSLELCLAPSEVGTFSVHRVMFPIVLIRPGIEAEVQMSTFSVTKAQHLGSEMHQPCRYQQGEGTTDERAWKA